MSDTTEDECLGTRPNSSSPSANPQGVTPRPSARSKAHIRVSLACVQCRSKHVKCDATLPACLRCQAEAKPCFYAKSRRGIRDPKKRSMISDRPPGSYFGLNALTKTSHSPPSTQQSTSPDLLYGDWSVGSGSHLKRSHTSEDEILIDLFYKHLHPSHPFLPPKRFFNNFFDADSDSYQFLLAAVKFCGSIYARETSENLRELAFTAASGSLPMTPQSVQGLLLLSIVACGDALFQHHAGWLDRALDMSMDIGMQHKAFADAAQDPVLAESFRRTWYILFFQQSTRFMKHSRSRVQPAGIDHNVDLPCDEWEYESGIIPPPVSVVDYEIRKTLGRVEFSSMAYLVDICKIRIELVLPYMRASDDKKQALFDRAESRICDWLRRIPRWKLDLVDQDGAMDFVIHLAVNLAHINRLGLRQAGVRTGLNLRDYFHFGPVNGPYRTSRLVRVPGWKAQPFELQAADGFCEFFRYTVPVKSLHPMIGSALLVVVLAYLDACVFQGLDSDTLREKVTMLLHVLSVHGDTWRLSRMIADEVRYIMKEYLGSTVSQGPKTLASDGNRSWNLVMGGPTMDFMTNGLLNNSLLPLPLESTELFQGWEYAAGMASWLGAS